MLHMQSPCWLSGTVSTWDLHDLMIVTTTKSDDVKQVFWVVQDHRHLPDGPYDTRSDISQLNRDSQRTMLTMKHTRCHIWECLQQINLLTVQFQVNIFASHCAPHTEHLLRVGRSVLFQIVIFFNGTNDIFFKYMFVQLHSIGFL